LFGSHRPGSVLASLHCPAHNAAHRCQVDTEVLGDLPIGVSARRIRRHNGCVSSRGTLGDLNERRGRRTALCLGHAETIPFNLGLALHACHERFVAQIDLLAQPVPDVLPYPLVHEDPIPMACLVPG